MAPRITKYDGHENPKTWKKEAERTWKKCGIPPD